MPITSRKPEPCIWCGWVNGEHASKCALNLYITEQAANLEWFPGRNEPPAPHEPQAAPAWHEAAVKLDCPE